MAAADHPRRGRDSMPDSDIESRPPRGGGRFYGWVIVAAVSVMLTTSAGLGFYALPVYLRTLTEERGFSVSSISGATAVFFVAAGCAGVGVGKVIARHDPRPVIAGGTLVGAVAI